MSTTLASRGALTTAFAPAESCLTDIYMFTGSDFYFMSLGPPNNLKECFPSSYAQETSAYYSPGISCPEGYVQACSSTEALGSVTETRATCCPSNYKCNTSFWPTALSNQVCQSYIPTNSIVTYSTFAAEGLTTVAWTAGPVDAVNGFGVQLRFQSTDLTPASTSNSATSTQPSSSRSSSTQSSSPSSNLSSTPTSTPSSSAVNSKSGLSTGAKAGIGIGCALVFLIALAALAMFFLKRRKQTAELENLTKEEVAEMDSRAAHIRYEMEVKPAEMEGNRLMGTGVQPHELQGSYGRT